MTISLGRKPRKSRSHASLSKIRHRVRVEKKSKTKRLKRVDVVELFRRSCLKIKSTPPPKLNDSEQLDQSEMNDLRGALYDQD